MEIVRKNLKNGEITLKVENLDDLWYLSHIIDKGDLISGKTFRKIKIGDEGDRKTQVVKKKVFLTISVEKLEFQETALKLLGKIESSHDDIKKGTHHSFQIEEQSILKIKKPKWLTFQLERLKEASAAEQPNILICILDREEALFAISKRKGYEILNIFKGDVQKKDEKVNSTGHFYQDIIKLLEEYTVKHKVKHIILASPVFWKEELMKNLKDQSIKKKIVLATCSSVTSNAIVEVLKRPEVKEVLRKMRTSKEIKLVEDLLEAIAKNTPNTYGLKQVEAAAQAGAVKTLLLTDTFIQKMREKEKYESLDKIMTLIDDTKGEIHIISHEHESGKKLEGLGGIAAILRYALN